MRAAEIELLLPEVIRRTVVSGSPMAALVGVMEAMQAPAEAAVRDSDIVSIAVPSKMGSLRLPKARVWPVKAA